MEQKKIRILYLDFAIPDILKDSSSPAGGAAAEWLSWIEGIKLTGNEIGVLTWKGAKEFINRDPGFDIIESYDLKKGIPFLRFLYYRFPSFFRAVREYNPDIIVQEGSSRLTFMASVVSKILKKIFIYRIASDKDVDDRITGKMGKRELFLYKKGLKYTDIFLCQNRYQYKMLKERFPGKKSLIIYPPFVINENIRLNGNQRSYVAFIGGGFRYEKNISALVEIVKVLPDIKFKITGKPGTKTDRASLDSIDKLKTFKNVEFVGFLKRDEIFKFLANAVALINTSHLEGFPTAFLESWALGTPVISTSKVNPDEIITNHNLGLVAENYAELPVMIRKIFTSEPNEELHKSCRDYVVRYHNPETLARNLIEFVQDNNFKLITNN